MRTCKMFKDWKEGKTGGSRSASFAYAVDDLRVIADNEEGKREDRFSELDKRMTWETLESENTGDGVLWRRSNEDGRSDRETRARLKGTAREIRKEGWKEKERERSISPGESEDEIVCMRHFAPPDQFSYRYPKAIRSSRNTSRTGICFLQVWACSRCRTSRLIYLNDTCF